MTLRSVFLSFLSALGLLGGILGWSSGWAFAEREVRSPKGSEPALLVYLELGWWNSIARIESGWVPPAEVEVRASCAEARCSDGTDSSEAASRLALLLLLLLLQDSSRSARVLGGGAAVVLTLGERFGQRHADRASCDDSPHIPLPLTVPAFTLCSGHSPAAGERGVA